MNKLIRDERIEPDSKFFRLFRNCKEACEQINFNKIYHIQNMKAAQISRRHSLSVSPRNKLEPAYVYEEQPISKLEIGQKTVDLSSFHLKLAKTTSEFNNSQYQRSVQ